MNPASAKQLDSQALEDLGRATLRIVHDLKNQLNGLKLYATFLRKRLEAENHSLEERETIEKMVGGLDRAARDLSMLVSYARPLDLRQRMGTDLRSVITAAAHDPAYRVSGPLNESFASDIGTVPLLGAFDAQALAEAFSALTREAFNGARPSDKQNLSMHARKEEDGSPRAIVEWRGLTARPAGAEPGVHSAFARRVVEAHGGVIEFEPKTIRVKLPLTE